MRLRVPAALPAPAGAAAVSLSGTFSADDDAVAFDAPVGAPTTVDLRGSA